MTSLCLVLLVGIVAMNIRLSSASKRAEDFIKSSKNVPEAIRKRGYPCEVHHVTTKDGYILTLHRIPGKNGTSTSPPVIMQHGLLSSSFSWVLESPHKAPAFLISDGGFDVWLPSLRGSVYSRNHTHFPTNSFEFWNFSWDEMGEFDFPAIIDYVLKSTNHSQLFYIGHSMGSTIFFSGMSFNPSYNSKVLSMYALGPVVTVAHIKSPLIVISYVEGLIKEGMKLFHKYEIFPEDSIFFKITQLGCKICRVSEELCSNILFLIVGFDRAQFNPDWLPVVTKQLLSGTSVNTVIHFGQEYRSGQYRRFDFGYYGNLKKYGHPQPPPYKLNVVESTVNLIWGSNDYLADSKDVQYLLDRIPNIGRISGVVKDPNFNHLDFLWAPEAKKLIYDRIIEDMKLQSN